MLPGEGGRGEPGHAGERATTAPSPTTTAATAAPRSEPATAAPEPAAGVTHRVASPEEWLAAVAAAGPGDTIELVATIDQPLQYHGPRSGTAEPPRGPDRTAEPPRGANGTAGRPITITAAPGVWIDPGDQRNGEPALLVESASHVHIVGVRVRNSQFGLRMIHATGSARAPVAVSGNVVQDIGHAGIHVAGHLDTHEPSRHIRIEANQISGTGRTTDTYGEGIYLGYGAREWVDETSDIAVVGNDISGTTGEGIDVKPGTARILVEGNLIHDLSPKDGGAISAHFVSLAANPDPSEAEGVLIRRNRIWNVNLEARPGANNWAIWVGHGGVTIEGNAIWGMQANANTLAVRIRALRDFGPHPIRIVDNVFWTANGWMAIAYPSGAGNVVASGNRGPSGASGVELSVEAGPAVPPIGDGGTADGGEGPGSAFGPWDSPAPLWLAE
jgi:hypothetical protein